MNENEIRDLLIDYHEFDDGLVMSFGFFYPVRRPLVARAVFYAKNHSVNEDRWDSVVVDVEDVVEFKSMWKGNQANSICAGVHIVNFEGVWCLDVDGVYDDVGNPKSIEDVRNIGDCYVMGKGVSVRVVEGKKVSLDDDFLGAGAD